MDKSKLLLYKLDLGELGVIHAPIVEDILQMGEEKFWNLLNPLGIDFDTFNVSKEEAQKEGIKRFDIFILPNNRELCNLLVNSLRYFYKTDKVILVDDIITINYKGNDLDKLIYINRDNFDELCEIILKLCNVEKAKEEKKREVEVISDEGKIAFEKLKKMREQNQTNDSKKVTLKQIVNIVVHGGNKNYKDVFGMTYYQLINSYSCIIQIDSYKTFMAYKTSGQFEIKEDIPHWTETIQ